MNNILIALTFILTSASAFSQREADAMYFGGCFGGGCWCNPPNQGNVFQFDDDSLQQIIDPACLQIGRFFSGAAFSDRQTGELIFASNGWRLINGQGDASAYKTAC